MRDENKQPRNTHLDNIEDMPREKVIRKDGLATVDDIAKLMGKEVPEDKDLTKSESAFSPKEKVEDQSESKSEKLSDFIEIIIRLPKPAL